MRARERPPAPQPQPIFPTVHVPGSSSGSSAPSDPYLALSSQLQEHRQQLSAEMTAHHQQISAELTAHRQQISAEMTAHYQRMEQLWTMISVISVTPCAIWMHILAASIRSLIGRFLFLLIVLSHFLLPALHSPPGLLLFHLRHLLHRRTLILVDMILMSSDPF